MLNTLVNLPNEIMWCCLQVTHEILQNVKTETKTHLYCCMEVYGVQFEHVIPNKIFKFVLNENFYFSEVAL